MKKRYFFYLLIGGKSSGSMDFRMPSELDDAEATSLTIELARLLGASNLKGILVCHDELGKSGGFYLEVPLDDVDTVEAQFPSLSKDDFLPGFEQVFADLQYFYKKYGNAFTAVMRYRIFSRTNVSCYHLGEDDFWVRIIRDRNIVECFKNGPSLREMMQTFQISEAEARRIWQAVVDELAEKRKLSENQ